MGIGDSIAFVGCLAGVMVALPALLVFLNMVFEGSTGAAAQRLDQGAITPFFVGVVLLIVAGIPTVGLISLGSVFQFIGSLMLLGLLLWAFMGLAAIARLVGSRIISRDAGLSVVHDVTIGALIVSFTVAFPLLGWLMILPFALVIGVGATALGRRSSRHHQRQINDDRDSGDFGSPEYDQPLPEAS